MPSLPKPRLRRAARTRAAVVAPSAETQTPQVSTIDAGPDGRPLRWINVERWRPAERAWLEEHFSFHPLDYEDVGSRNQRPKVDEYDDYLFIVLQFPRYDKQLGRLAAIEIDIFLGPDYLITIPERPLQSLDYLFERYLDDTRDRSMEFFHWVETVYDPDELKRSFHASSWGNILTNRILRRE